MTAPRCRQRLQRNAGPWPTILHGHMSAGNPRHSSFGVRVPASCRSSSFAASGVLVGRKAPARLVGSEALFPFPGCNSPAGTGMPHGLQGSTQ